MLTIIVQFEDPIQTPIVEFVTELTRDTFHLVWTLTQSEKVKAFKMFENGEQLTDLYKRFGWGAQPKFCPVGFSYPDPNKV